MEKQQNAQARGLTGLVLEGGAMRGLFSAGVMDAMMEAGIAFDGIVGVSAGAAFGCNYKSGQAGRALRYNVRFARDRRYCGLWSLLRTGDLFGARFAYHVVPGRLDRFDDAAFERSPAEFYAVCTDVETGRPVYKLLMTGGHHTYDWIRASASMPVVSRVVELEGHKLLDGGMTDSIPLAFMQGRGYGRSVVILTQPADYRKQPTRLMPIISRSLRRYPLAVEAMRQRHEMYNRQLDYVAAEERRGTAFVIRPDEPLPIGHTSHHPDEMRRVHDIGLQKGRRLADQVRRFVEGLDTAPQRQKN